MELWYDSFGDRKNPPLLLLTGAACQGIIWTKTFCKKLASLGFFVIRFDQRDTGFSSYTDIPYTFLDMANDAIGLLDALSLSAAHFMSISMGGAIAQIAAVHFPSRVLSLTLIATTNDFYPVAAAIRGEREKNFALSRPELEWFNWVKEVEAISPFAFIKRLRKHILGWRILNGKRVSFPSFHYARLMAVSIVRQRSYKALLRHRTALLSSLEQIRDTQGKIKIPTFVIHGGNDPLFPKDHAEHLAASIPGSTLLLIEEMGHNFCPCFHDDIIREVGSFIANIDKK